MPIIIGMLLMLLLLTLPRASLALLTVEAIIAPVGVLVVSTISPGLCGPVISAAVIPPVIVVLGRWVRKALCCQCVCGVTTGSMWSPSLVVRGRALKAVLMLVGIIVGLSGVLLRVRGRGIMGVGALSRISLIILVVVLPAWLLLPSPWGGSPAIVG